MAGVVFFKPSNDSRPRSHGERFGFGSSSTRTSGFLSSSGGVLSATTESSGTAKLSLISCTGEKLPGQNGLAAVKDRVLQSERCYAATLSSMEEKRRPLSAFLKSRAVPLSVVHDNLPNAGSSPLASANAADGVAAPPLATWSTTKSQWDLSITGRGHVTAADRNPSAASRFAAAHRSYQPEVTSHGSPASTPALLRRPPSATGSNERTGERLFSAPRSPVTGVPHSPGESMLNVTAVIASTACSSPVSAGGAWSEGTPASASRGGSASIAAASPSACTSQRMKDLWKLCFVPSQVPPHPTSEFVAAPSTVQRDTFLYQQYTRTHLLMRPSSGDSQKDAQFGRVTYLRDIRSASAARKSVPLGALPSHSYFVQPRPSSCSYRHRQALQNEDEGEVGGGGNDDDERRMPFVGGSRSGTVDCTRRATSAASSSRTSSKRECACSSRLS